MLRFLKDPESSVSDKVKVARYVWQEDSVTLPNKRQFLLDWLTNALFGKKRVTGMEAGSLWLCLHDMLHDARCHRPSKSGHAVALKAVVYQSLLEKMKALTGHQDDEKLRDDIIISCCLALVTSPSLSHHFAAKFDYMVQLLGCCVQLCTQKMKQTTTPQKQKTLHQDQCGGTVDKSLLRLTKECLHLTTATASPEKVVSMVSQHLLNPVGAMGMLICHYGNTHPQVSELRQLTEDLLSLLITSLFPKEMLPYYELYLTLKTETTQSVSSPPKFIEAFFSQLFQGQKEESRQDLQLVATMYKGFLNSYRGSAQSTVGFQFARLICDRLAVVSIKPVPAPTSHTSSQALLSMLRDILQLIGQWGIHDVSNEAQVTWLKQLIGWLLEDKGQRLPVWFECVGAMLELNHMVLESQMSQVLAKSWIQCPTTDEVSSVRHSQGALLSAIVHTYSRLRQVDRFISKLLQAIAKTDADHEEVVFPEEFLNSVSACVSDLPQVTTVEVWNLLLQDLSKVTQTGEEPGWKACMLLTLLSITLSSARLTDYSITQHVATRVQHLMDHTRTEVIMPRLKAVAEKTVSPGAGSCRALLRLLHSHGQLHLLLSRYSASYRPATPALTATDAEVQAHDLSWVHPGLSVKDWRRLHAGINSTAEPVTQVIWVELVLQKACAVSMSSEQPPRVMWGIIEHLRALVMTQHSDCHLEHSWDGQLNTLSCRCVCVALWQRVCQHLPVLQPSMTAEQLLSFTQYALWTLTAAQPASTHSGGLSAGTTLRCVSLHLLHSTVGQEMLVLLEGLAKQAWHQVAVQFNPPLTGSADKKKKRKRMSSSRHSMQEAFDQLLALHQLATGVSDTTKDTAKVYQTVCEHLNNLLQDSDSVYLEPLSCAQVDKLVQTLKVILALPVEHLSATSQLQCIMGSLLLMIVTGRDGVDTGLRPEVTEVNRCMTEVTQCVEQLLMLTLSGTGSASQALDWVDVSRLLQWYSTRPVTSVNGRLEGERGIRQREQVPISTSEGGRDALLWLLLKLSCRSHCSLLQLKQFILTAIDLHPGAEAPSLGHRPTQVLLCVHRCVIRMLAYSHVRDDLRDALDEMYPPLHRWYLALLAAHLQRHNTGAQPSSAAAALCCHLVPGLSRELIHGCSAAAAEEERDEGVDGEEAGDGDVEMVDDNGKKASALSELKMFLPQVCEICVGQLTKNKGEEGELLASLQFIQTLCQHHTAVEGHLPGDFLQSCWTALLLMLETTKEVCHWQSKVKHGDSSQPVCNSLAEEHKRLPARHNTRTATWNHMQELRTATQRLHEHRATLDQSGAKSCDVSYDLGSCDRSHDAVQTLKLETGEETLSGPHTGDVSSRELCLTSHASKQLSEGEETEVRKCLSAIASRSKVTEFTQLIQSLLGSVDLHHAERSVSRVVLALEVWDQVVEASLQPDTHSVLLHACHSLLLKIQQMVSLLSASWDSSFCLVVVAALNTQRKLLDFGPSVLTGQHALLCLHSCYDVPLAAQPLPQFLPMFQAVYAVVNALLLHHEGSALQSTQSIVAAAKHLLVGMVHQGAQRQAAVSAQEVESLAGCAHLLDRLFNLMASHKAHFSKVVIYILAEYANEVQKVTLIPKVKSCLLPGLYALLDVCDPHGVSLLHTVLAAGVREIFKTLYSDYTRYHKYTGKV